MILLFDNASLDLSRVYSWVESGNSRGGPLRNSSPGGLLQRDVV